MMLSFDPRLLEGVSLLFDLDGTLLDTAPTFLRIGNTLLQKEGHPPVSLEVLRNSISYGVKAMIRTIFGHYNLVLSESDVESHAENFLQMYQNDPILGTKPYDGLKDVLETLHKTPVGMAVATNKTQEYAIQLVKAFGWDKYFPVVLGPQGVTQKKPSPVHLYETVLALGRESRFAIMIGDSDVDQQAAQAAKMPFILHTQGYFGDRQHIKSEASFESYDDFEKSLKQALFILGIQYIPK